MMKTFMPVLLCLLSGLLTATADAPRMQSVIRFDQEQSRNWQSGEQPARLQPEKTHAELKLNFKRDDRQIILTRTQRMDLSSFTSLRLRAGIENPEVLLEGQLSFKSGSGWYVHPFTLHDAGFNHLLFSKSAFSKQGTPAGWNRVEAVRMSFWPREKGSVLLQLSSLDGFVDTLWVVDPEPLAQTGDETYLSRVSVRHFDRLLSGLGIPHAVVEPSDLIGVQNPPALIVFPYLPRLPQEQYQQLNRMITQGTRMIVFESAHAGFARKLGVELGAEVSSATVGQFDHWLNKTPDFPARIYQHAWSFRQIRPLPGAVVRGFWHDALGRNSRQPACIESSQGVWANVAWRSGDVTAKQRALGEWIGRLAPELLTESLRFHLETRSPQQFEQRFGIIGRKPSATVQLRKLADQKFAEAKASTGQPLTAFRSFQLTEQLMQRAYASGQPEWDAKLKGIWDQNGTGFYAGSWDQTCRELKAAGFNAVFPNMASAGRAHYPSALIPPSKSLEKYGDQLKAFSAAARNHGLQAHAWKICWKLNTRLPAFEEKMRREGRLMQDANGKTIPWLSLSDPRNIQFEIDSLLEMARHAPLDGIHLDYMRYPGREADYGPAARRAYEARIGHTLPQWPREVLEPGGMKADFQVFRQQQVHRAVKLISEAVKKEFPDLKLSVAVWGAWPDCADAQGQDWPVWAENGWVDWLIPMNYTDNPDQFAGWLDLQRSRPGVASRLIPGIGLISTNAELSPAQLLQQLELVKERKLPGAVLYRLDPSLETRLFPYLKLWK